MSACSQCGVTFSCGMVDTKAAVACWCTALPTMQKNEVVRDEEGKAKSCMCPACLSVLRTRRGSGAVTT